MIVLFVLKIPFLSFKRFSTPQCFKSGYIFLNCLWSPRMFPERKVLWGSLSTYITSPTPLILNSYTDTHSHTHKHTHISTHTHVDQTLCSMLSLRNLSQIPILQGSSELSNQGMHNSAKFCYVYYFNFFHLLSGNFNKCKDLFFLNFSFFICLFNFFYFYHF